MAMDGDHEGLGDDANIDFELVRRICGILKASIHV